MELKEAKISILIGDECTTIAFIDGGSGIPFAEASLTNKQLAKSLGRLSHFDCKIQVVGLDKVGKTMENIQHHFEVPENSSKELIKQICEQTMPDGWQSDHYYGSQNSFYKQDGKQFVQTTIRRYV